VGIQKKDTKNYGSRKIEFFGEKVWNYFPPAVLKLHSHAQSWKFNVRNMDCITGIFRMDGRKKSGLSVDFRVKTRFLRRISDDFSMDGRTPFPPNCQNSVRRCIPLAVSEHPIAGA
jgi:hypothetical protein